MKGILRYGFCLFGLILFSCNKKNNVEEHDKPAEHKMAVVNIYSNAPSAADGLQSEGYIAKEDAHVYVYGDFDSDGLPNTFKSMAIQQGNDISNFIFDEQERVIMSYKSYANGAKENYLVKYDYLAGGYVKISFYEYNWSSKSDKLLYQNIILDNNGSLSYNVTFARQAGGSNRFFSYERKAKLIYELKKAKEYVALALGVGAVIAVPVVVVFAVSASAISVPTGAIIIIAEIMFLTMPSKADELKQSSTLVYPSSPSFGPLPSLTGTPAFPGGYSSLITGSWKIVSYVVCETDLYKIPAGEKFVSPCGELFGKVTCERDNIWKFNADRSTSMSEGALVCAFPDNLAGNYSLDGNKLTWFWNSRGTSSAEIILLNSTTMVLKSAGVVTTLQRI